MTPNPSSTFTFDSSLRAPVDVHIGTEKTGSTAIQHYLARNNETLNSQYHVLVPTTLGSGASVNLAAACQTSATPDSLRRMRSLTSQESVLAYFHQLQQTLANEITNKRPQRLLLSCENFSSRLKTKEDIARLHDFLAPFAAQIRIIVYLRRQEDMIVSSHTTKIRNGFQGRFNYPPPGRERPDAHYDQLLARWADVFGDESLTVKLYEPKRLHNGDIVDDFCTCVSIPNGLSRDEARQNTSPDPTTLEIMRQLNAYVPHVIENKPNPLRRDLMNALTAMSNESLAAAVPPPPEEFLARFEKGNREVAQRWFSDDATVPETLFPEARQIVDSVVPHKLDNELLVKTCATLWNHAQTEILGHELEIECLKGELLLAKGPVDRALTFCQRLHRRFPENQRAADLMTAAEEAAKTAR